jgi:hypothetical protein
MDSMDTKNSFSNKKLINPRIQIAAVGFEVDRIVLPAIEYKADLVYLMVHSNVSEDKATGFVDKIIEKLKKKKIKVEKIYADRFDLFEIIREIKNIIRENRKADFLINVASGSKIHAIAFMMACMIFDDRSNIKPFYAVPVDYHKYKGDEQQTSGVKEVQLIPTYRINTPEDILLKALTVIKELIEKSNNKRVTKKELATTMEEKKIIKVGGETEEGSKIPKNHRMSKYTTLDKKIIKPLKLDWGFIDEERVGKNRRIFFTEDGIAASKFLF